MLLAYSVDNIIVFAQRGTEAKLLAAPKLRDMSAWREDVAAWVALRADRKPELDCRVDQTMQEPYIDESL